MLNIVHLMSVYINRRIPRNKIAWHDVILAYSLVPCNVHPLLNCTISTGPALVSSQCQKMRVEESVSVLS